MEKYNIYKDISTRTNGDIYTIAATNGNEHGILLTNYNDVDVPTTEKIEVSFDGLKDGSVAKIYVLDAQNDMTLLRKEKIKDSKIALDIPLFTSYYIAVK